MILKQDRLIIRLLTKYQLKIKLKISKICLIYILRVMKSKNINKVDFKEIKGLSSNLNS
jgi:hypothetical protein